MISDRKKYFIFAANYNYNYFIENTVFSNKNTCLKSKDYKLLFKCNRFFATFIFCQDIQSTVEIAETD